MNILDQIENALRQGWIIRLRYSPAEGFLVIEEDTGEKLPPDGGAASLEEALKQFAIATGTDEDT